MPRNALISINFKKSTQLEMPSSGTKSRNMKNILIWFKDGKLNKLHYVLSEVYMILFLLMEV
jgi:hypothetical protein